MIKKNLPILFIILAAFIFRVAGISSLPIGFTQDEAVQGYDAYSILKTGKDQWGTTFPWTFRSFGDFKLPVYTYLSVPSIALFGLNEFSVRLPAAICGTLAVLFTYLMVMQLFKHRTLALWSCLLLSISPWHLSLSRGAFEANLSSLFLPLAVWLFYLGMEKYNALPVSAFFFGINLFTYHSARIVTILLLIPIILINLKKLAGIFKLPEYKRYLIFAVSIFVLFFAGALYTMTAGAQKRAVDVVVFNPTDNWKAMADRRYEAIKQNVPEVVARIFSNKVVYTLSAFSRNYLSYLSFSFLFIQGAGDASYGMIPGRGVLYAIEVIFILSALVLYVRKNFPLNVSLIILWILLSPIPAAVSKAPGYSANRASVMMPALQILSAYGVYAISEYMKNKSLMNSFLRRFNEVIISILFVSFLFFIEDYVYHAPIQGAASMQFGRKEAIDCINQVNNQYDEIFISRSLSVPQVWVQFYNSYDPLIVQEASKKWLKYEEEGFDYLDQYDGYRLGKYKFGSLDLQNIKSGKVLFVGSPWEFNPEREPLKVIYYPEGKPSIYIKDNSIL